MPAETLIELTTAASSPPTCAIPCNDAEHTVNEIVRLLDERSLPNGRGGMVVWAWIGMVPLLWAAVVIALVSLEWLDFWILLAALLTGRSVSNFSAFRSEANAALLLPELDKEWLAALIAALAYPKRTVRAIARLRLMTILPTLREFDADQLSPDRRAMLYDQLTPEQAWSQPDFLCSILQFGAATGDELALGGMEHLAGMQAFNSAQRRVRSAARRYLPSLEEQVARQIAAQDADAQVLTSEASGLEASRRQLSPEARALLEETDAESGRSPGMRFGFLLASWGAVIPYTVYQTIFQWRQGSYFFSIGWLLCTVAASQLYRLAILPHQARRANKLAGIEEIEAVGPLVEMITWPDKRIQSMAIAGLTRLLPRLKSTDTQLLSASHRIQLYQTLRLANARRHAEFLVALLAGLEQAGDLAALQYVRDLAAARPNNLRERRVVEAAAACLPYLEGCARQNRDSQTLLRAFTSALPEANLLRPAGKQANVDPELLLRTATLSDPTKCERG